jgi:hypothetical protein
LSWAKNLNIQITGYTYNLEDGKIVREKLSKDYIFTENISEYTIRTKFAFSSVKVGSVVEYKYTKRVASYHPGNYVFQRSIPVQYSRCRIVIPEYFVFNREIRGFVFPEVKIKTINQTATYNGQTISYNAEELTAEIKDLPALKDDEYVWNYREFLCRINFELKSISKIFYKNFAQTLKQIVKSLNEDKGFGKAFKDRKILKDELATTLVDKSTDVDSIGAILNLVRSKIKYNGYNTIWAMGIGKALKDGSGSSGEVNGVLLNALKNAGFDAYPAVLSTRSNGRIPFTHPSINSLNYFIVCVHSGDNVYYLDATRPYTDISIIPIDCLVEEALIIYPNSFDWIDLTRIGNNIDKISMIVKFNEEGFLSGQKRETYFGEFAYVFKQDYDKAEDQDKYVELLEAHNDITISGYTMEEKPTLTETYDFIDRRVRLEENDIISFSPLLFFAMRNNAFKSETRDLPVEFSFPYEQRIYVTIVLPEGYVVDELPTEGRFVFNKDQIDCSYYIQAFANNIQLSYNTKLSKCIIPAVEYGGLRDFWAKMYNKENELVVIRKAN